MIDRRGSPVTEGLGTTTLISRGYGGDAHEQRIEIRTRTTLALEAVQRSSINRKVSLKTFAPVVIEQRSTLMREGGYPWRNF